MALVFRQLTAVEGLHLVRSDFGSVHPLQERLYSRILFAPEVIGNYNVSVEDRPLYFWGYGHDNDTAGPS